MKTCNRCSIIVALNRFIFTVTIATGDHPTPRPRLEAMHNSLYAEQLYLRVRNPEKPTSDDYVEARMRQLVCQEITSNEYFYERKEYAVDEDNIRDTLKAEYKTIYKLIYKWRKSTLSLFVNRSISRRGRVYQNPYVYRKFRISRYVSEDYNENVVVGDHVFICLTSGNHAADIKAYYVTKEYDLREVRTSPNERMVGRFVFSYAGGKFEGLIEEAAWARINPKFNVETYYLKMRQRYQPVSAENGAQDPVCRLTIHENGPNNQWLRLCKLALRSLHFKTKVRCPRKWEGEAPCHFKAVSFRTKDARRQIENQPTKYYEWMAPCAADEVGTNEEVHFFISRAYASNQVFVYGESKSDSEETVYLENLSRNISLVETELVRSRSQPRCSSDSEISHQRGESSQSVDWGKDYN